MNLELNNDNIIFLSLFFILFCSYRTPYWRPQL